MGDHIMAVLTKVERYDDLDGQPGATTVTFGLDGTVYDIDLSDEHAAVLREVLSPYVEAGRKQPRNGAAQGAVASRGRRSQASSSSEDRQRTAEIRRWAQEQGLEVNDRGRVPARIVQAFEAATGAAA